MTNDNTVGSAQPLGILGGTFDPIHQGHVLTLEAAAQACGLSHLLLMPLGVAVHRQQPRASASQRVHMCKLATRDKPHISVDEREVQRGGDSYTILTLQELRQEHGPERPLCWFMGRDAIDGFTRWKNWQGILELAHIIVMTRPGYQWQAPLPEALQPYQASGLEGPSGRIIMQAVTPYDISSTRIRQCLANQQALSAEDQAFMQGALHENVRKYLLENDIYT